MTKDEIIASEFTSIGILNIIRRKYKDDASFFQDSIFCSFSRNVYKGKLISYVVHLPYASEFVNSKYCIERIKYSMEMILKGE